jgi:hypothetical protein
MATLNRLRLAAVAALPVAADRVGPARRVVVVARVAVDRGLLDPVDPALVDPA